MVGDFLYISSMKSVKNPKGYWTYDRCKEEISKMVYLKDLQGTTVKNVITKNGWFSELTSHLIRLQSKPYTEDQCREESKKYKTPRLEAFVCCYWRLFSGLIILFKVGFVKSG